MPELAHTLQGHDLGFLKMVAGLWGIELEAPDAHSALPALARALLQPALAQEVIEGLPEAAQAALRDLIENEGRLPWPLFARRYGEVRAMGAARRDRERPDLRPASPAEMLWYRALVGQAFLNLAPEPQEYAYIPEDLVALIRLPAGDGNAIYGRPASPGECAHPIAADDSILDHACTLLAGLRMGLTEEKIPAEGWKMPLAALQQLLASADLLDSRHMPRPEPVRAFLEAPRGEALASLVKNWQSSARFNELRLLPGLEFEGDWANDPLLARQAILDLLSHLPQNTWWSLAAFVNDVREKAPDFQRPAGDYDSWFIRRSGSAQFLRGFGAWDEVDGALIRYLICGPLHWLGLLDLAASGPGGPASAFRTSAWANDLWVGQPPAGLGQENQPVQVSTTGIIRVGRLAPRAVRYQIARSGSWLAEEHGEYRYRITPEALESARKQGLRSTALVSLLRKHSSAPLPPLLLKALERWEQAGCQARLETVSLLRVSDPQVLAALRKTQAARYLVEELSATAVIIRPGSAERILNALAEIGYLGEATIEGV